ncbi:MAG: nucleotide exchange factor GrpE [Candidatus Paceibacterota bacterium]|jgi:molecular chaperone GrpE
MTIKNQDQNEEDIILEPTEEETGDENIRQKIKDLREKLDVCSKEKADYLAGWQRAKADYINLEKDSLKSRKESIQFASSGIVEDIIPVLDSFEMAMGNKEAWDAVSSNWRTGVEYIYNQLRTVLENNGVSEICPKVGDDVKFDHHAVVETVPAVEKEKDGKISAVLQKGYSLNGKVLRPARVNAFTIS